MTEEGFVKSWKEKRYADIAEVKVKYVKREDWSKGVMAKIFVNLHIQTNATELNKVS